MLAVGSYTFAKTLEHKAKQGLNSGKEVTVVPPLEYQERFVAAMDDYFLACPGALPCLSFPTLSLKAPQTNGPVLWTIP